VVSDSDLAPRLNPILGDIVKILNSLTPKMSYAQYFEFLAEFVRYYVEVLPDHICEILHHVIMRILEE